jgi:8-oxo-dGTP diphosphatase
MQPKREYPDHPFVGVGALVHRGGKVLLARRTKEPNRGRWIIPGGLVELGEQLEDAVVREVREELGFEATADMMLDVASEVVLDDEERVKYHYVLVDFLVSPRRDDDVVLNEESSSYGWFTPESIEELDTTPNTKKMVRRYLQIAKPSSSAA